MSRPHADERVRFVRPDAIPGLELLLVEQSRQAWRVLHESYVVCTCGSGVAGWRYRSKDRLLTGGGYMLMEPGETHATSGVFKPLNFKAMFIDPAVVENTAREIGLSWTPHFRLSQDFNPAISRVLEQFCASVDATDTLLEQQSRFAGAMRLLLESYAEGARPKLLTGNCSQVFLQRAEAYLREHFNESISLDELCAAVGLSRFHLLRAFTRHFGLPPHAYQIRIRIERAKAMLRAGQPLSTTAANTGFADQSHFTRHFRKIWRITPGQYARAAGCSLELDTEGHRLEASGEAGRQEELIRQ